jgi:pimeloyl-ACP methyl ester carboxylesterase
MFLDLNGATFNTVSFGTGGIPFVAHGGWTGSWELWQQPFELMSTTRRCVSYDHRGTGATLADPATITAGQLVADLIGIVDAMGIGRSILAGESMGGLVALMAAARHPERFAGLVLIDAASEVTPEGAGWLVDGARSDYAATVKGFVDACVPEDEEGHIRRWGRQILMRSDPESAARLFEGSYGVSADLGAITVPSLVIRGSRDTLVSAQASLAMSDALPNSEHHVIEGAGHVPTATRPHEVVAIIEDWITRTVEILEAHAPRPTRSQR